MSFSKQVKQELCKIRLRGAGAKRAQLAGLTHAAGALLIGAVSGIEYTTETPDVGKLIASFAASLYDVEATLSLRESGRARMIDVTLAGSETERLLSDAGLLIRSGDGVELTNAIPARLLPTQESKRAFLRGVFLGAGSVANPKSTYHLEIICRSDALADSIIALLRDFACEAKTFRRNNKTVVYLKEGDRIAMFLALIGASVSTLQFEGTRVEKDLRNYINRTSNCETANIGKTVNASQEQIDAIRRILGNPVAKKRLSPKLIETAELRLNNPEMSLSELAELCGIGKSGMNHRLQRLVRLAEDIYN